MHLRTYKYALELLLNCFVTYISQLLRGIIQLHTRKCDTHERKQKLDSSALSGNRSFSDRPYRMENGRQTKYERERLNIDT